MASQFFIKIVPRIDFLKKASKELLTELSFHVEVKQYEFNQVVINPGEQVTGIFIIIKGVVEVFTKLGDNTFTLDYLTKGSVIGQYSSIASEQLLFGMRSVVSGGSSLLLLHTSTLDVLRLKRNELETLLLQAEDQIEKWSIPTIDYVIYNDDKVKQLSAKEDAIRKFQRAIKRMLVIKRSLAL